MEADASKTVALKIVALNTAASNETDLKKDASKTVVLKIVALKTAASNETDLKEDASKTVASKETNFKEDASKTIALKEDASDGSDPIQKDLRCRLLEKRGESRIVKVKSETSNLQVLLKLQKDSLSVRETDKKTGPCFGFASAKDFVRDIISGPVSNVTTVVLDDSFVASTDFHLLTLLNEKKIINSWLEPTEGSVELNSIELIPIKTTSDGNCLLHAVSIGVFGHEDKSLALRGHFYNYMEKHSAALKELYVIFEKMKIEADGLTVQEYTWDKDWQEVVEISKPKAGKIQKSLEEIHIFALANMLNRPIVVFAPSYMYDVNGQPISPIKIGGIYIPSLFEVDNTYQPLLLSYLHGHFSALLCNERSSSKKLQITDAIHFTTVIGIV